MCWFVCVGVTVCVCVCFFRCAVCATVNMWWSKHPVYFSLFIYSIFKSPKALSNSQWKIGFFSLFVLLRTENFLLWCDIIISYTSNNLLFAFSEKWLLKFQVMQNECGKFTTDDFFFGSFSNRKNTEGIDRIFFYRNLVWTHFCTYSYICRVVES